MRAQSSIRTYVFRRGCTDTVPLDAPFPEDLSFPWTLSSPAAVVETKVEKCLEDGTRGRAPVGGAAAVGVWAVAVVVVVVVDWEFAVELARKRDWEWFEK